MRAAPWVPPVSITGNPPVKIMLARGTDVENRAGVDYAHDLSRLTTSSAVARPRSACVSTTAAAGLALAALASPRKRGLNTSDTTAPT